MAKPQKEQVLIRRAPRIWPFAITGAVIGVLLALLSYLVLGQQTPENPLGLLIIGFGSLGAGVGISIAVALDWLFAKKTKRVSADRISE